MRFFGIHLVVPRRDVEHLVDVLECNGYICEVQQPTKTEDPVNSGPRHLHVSIPEDSLIESDDEMCDHCGEWDGKHAEDCPGDKCACCGEKIEEEAEVKQN